MRAVHSVEAPSSDIEVSGLAGAQLGGPGPLPFSAKERKYPFRSALFASKRAFSVSGKGVVRKTCIPLCKLD